MMKKRFIVVGFAAVMFLAVSAQITQKEDPPKPPKAPAEKVNDIPPPPPPPPAPHEPPAPPAPPEPPLPPKDFETPDEYEAFLKSNPSVKSLGWTMKNEVVVRLKSGKEERYMLDDEKSRKEAEKKYGKFPLIPPPPPPPPPTPRPTGFRQ